MAEPLSPSKMTIDEFLAFTDERPDDERWNVLVRREAPILALARVAARQNLEQGAEHYVVVHQRQVAVVRSDRATGWRPLLHRDVARGLALPALGAEIPHAESYDGTPLSRG